MAVAAECKFIVQTLRQFQCAAADLSPFLLRLPTTCKRNPIPTSTAGLDAGAGAADTGCCTDSCCSMAIEMARVERGTASASASLSSACTRRRQRGAGRRRERMQREMRYTTGGCSPGDAAWHRGVMQDEKNWELRQAVAVQMRLRLRLRLSKGPGRELAFPETRTATGCLGKSG